ncbi:hypothetical protein FG386_001554 [Cryptosporidium ryanae]|uniref:uncharacterized protein n=1 Tax=Cryptosporidium ryanae TaxID=515981 RepID=UPI003519F78D|nr:hypothetical protein FG386_001554 [Cryptosporidium ryanae]
MFLNIKKFIIFSIFISFSTLVLANEKLLSFDGTQEKCKHCTVKKEDKISERLTDAFLLLKKEKELIKGESIRVKPFGKLPSPPSVGESDVGGLDVTELLPEVEEVQYIVPEPKEIQVVKPYDVLSEEIEFPEDITEEIAEEDDDDEEELILSKLKLGGQMNILSRKLGDNVKFSGIDSANLSCDLLDTVVVKKPSLRRQKVHANSGDKEVSVKILKLSTDASQPTVSDGNDLEILSLIREEKGKSSDDSHIESKISRSQRKARVLPNTVDCELCSKSSKCFFHRRGDYNLEDISSEQNVSGVPVEEDKDEGDLEDENAGFLGAVKESIKRLVSVGIDTASSSNTTASEEPSKYLSSNDLNSTNASESEAQSVVVSKTTDSDKSQFVSDDDDEEASEDKNIQGELDRIESSDIKQESDLQKLMNSMTSLVKMIKESKEEQVRTRKELMKERSILAKIAQDLDNTKNVTHLYIQMAKIDMEAALAKQSIEQLKRDEEKNKATAELLIRYENQTGIELETVRNFIKKAKEPSKKLLDLFDKISSRKATIQTMQIDVSKRLDTIRNRIIQLSEYISELEKQRSEIKSIISKISNIQLIDDQVDQ